MSSRTTRPSMCASALATSSPVTPSAFWQTDQLESSRRSRRAPTRPTAKSGGSDQPHRASCDDSESSASERRCETGSRSPPSAAAHSEGSGPAIVPPHRGPSDGSRCQG